MSISAASLYEAAALALAEFEKSGYSRFFGTKDQPNKPARTTLQVVLPAADRGLPKRTGQIDAAHQQSGSQTEDCSARGRNPGGKQQHAPSERDVVDVWQALRKARREFQRLHPCPSTGKATGACPGYVVDHIVPLKRGGLDEVSNMQWQTIAEARAKDHIE